MTAPAAIDTTLERVRSVLEIEKDLLTSGRAHEAADLIGEKMTALEAFDQILEDNASAPLIQARRRSVETILAMARENEAHFTAVRNGLSNVVARLETMSNDAYVGAYQQGGGQTPFSKASGNYSKKV